jgi:protein-tyrosine-phosphatase
MRHSVGVVDIPQDVRHEDWRVGDPLGAPVEEIRRVCADIEHRVSTLLSALGVPATDYQHADVVPTGEPAG